MSDVQTLLTRCRELGATFLPGSDGTLKVQAPTPLPDDLRTALKQCKAEVLKLLHQQSAFLHQYIPQAALDVYSDWQGLLIKSSVLEMNVWVVRSRTDGAEIAKETGQPALLLDDILRQKGRTREEARTALLPVLISPGGMQ